MAKTLNKYCNNWNFFDTKGIFPPFNKNNVPIAFFSIISLFSEDANYNLKECYVNCDRLFIQGYSNGKQNELMLRYNSNAEDGLVVARVEFIHKRKGKMTELYRILKLIQRKYHTGPIVMEAVVTEEMRKWCGKNNFYEDKVSKGNYIQSQ